ncbi:MAG: translesion DNA synthesis-associated protein ImuA [Gammaproteobacteria bacterium]|jgi:cell division inhibitor SulA|nr:hypothetical protein [Gammaproteobacteria bacterium]MDP6096900.1 translesion DNA synthesis-associated protein ImuA [Gammaproteobacteria bacterium]HJO11492.1 translesion DNA synthesis-associated protein ImuA [Gammaproteobacteria bacterium]|tara:strand:- start:265 stop:966 length:702 start_codon:yes stop_codon:yes gene_type:complete
MTIIRNSSENLEATTGKACGHIDQLIHDNPYLWRGCEMAGQGSHGHPTGYPDLDAILPGRGWPNKGMVEIVSSSWGMGELQLLIPLMCSIVEQGKWILWISPPYLLYAPALVQAGINTEQVLVLDLDTSCKDALWSMEKALQTESCGLVLAWQNWLPGKVLRRLQLAAETGDTLGVLFQQHVSKYSPSPLCLEIRNSLPEGSQNRARSQHIEVGVLKARGNFRPLSTHVSLHR